MQILLKKFFTKFYQDNLNSPCWFHHFHNTLQNKIGVSLTHCVKSFYAESISVLFTAQKMKISMNDFFIKCNQIHSFLWIP